MTAVSVTTATTAILAPSSVYTDVIIQNIGAAIAFINWDGGPATAANGYSLAVSGVLSLSGKQCQRGINGITTAGTADIRLQAV